MKHISIKKIAYIYEMISRFKRLKPCTYRKLITYIHLISHNKYSKSLVVYLHRAVKEFY